MPSFNWSRLRPIAHSIASTIRHAQASAYQLHRDLETIREENRRYAAEHYGTAPHWDGYGPARAPARTATETATGMETVISST